MIQHISLVYEAGGLTANEKHLLGAYANHTDSYGYCWPGVERLADETGLSVRTVKRTNAALRAKGLIKAVQRTNPKTGRQITNLTRLNITLLASMKRPPRDYGDNLVEQITFDDDTDQPGCQPDTPPGANLTPPGCQVDTPGGVNLTPKSSQESSREPSSPPSPPARQCSGRRGAGRGREEESSTTSTNDIGALGRAGAIVDRAVECWPSGHRAPNARDRRRLAERVQTELDAGGDERVIVDELTRDFGDVHSAVGLVLTRTSTPGWGRSVDPRPDRSKYEITGPKPAWCGRCDERTRHVVMRRADGGESFTRCECHPARVERDQEVAFGGSDTEVSPLEDLSADLETPTAAPVLPRRSGAPDPSRVDLGAVRQIAAQAAEGWKAAQKF